VPTEKPRVLHVIARFNVGGTARYLENLLPGLAVNFETLLAVGNVQGYEIEDHRLESIEFIRIEHLGRRISPMRDIRAYLELRRTVKRFEPHIIHSHTFKAGLLSRLMFFQIPKVHTFHGHLLGDPEFSSRVRRMIVNSERILAKLTKKLISVGEQVSKDLLDVGIGRPDQYVSIASESRRLDFLSRDMSRAMLAIHSDVRVVLWMARMAPVKNPLLTLEVARLLPDVNFLMAGGGELFNKIHELAPPNVRLLGWVEAANVIPAADIFLSTSFSEGVPYSLLEALSAGVPIIAVESGAIPEIVRNGVNGILTSQDPKEISAQIWNLISNSSLDLANREKNSVGNAQNSNELGMNLKHISVYKEILL
jgi:glycosyltransferase involved in cell wall biosynthesis